MTKPHPNVHSCSELPATGVAVVLDNRDYGAGGWTLVACREATEDDLEQNHYLEQVGDSIWTFTAQIRCCPYCGLKLELPDKHTAAGAQLSADGGAEAYGRFSLFDQEAWGGRSR